MVLIDINNILIIVWFIGNLNNALVAGHNDIVIANLLFASIKLINENNQSIGQLND